MTDTGHRQRWITFDCFGTLVDWHSGFAAVVKPLAGERTAIEILTGMAARRSGAEL